jgi:hypothetical protein
MDYVDYRLIARMKRIQLDLRELQAEVGLIAGGSSGFKSQTRYELYGIEDKIATAAGYLDEPIHRESEREK